jgi:hypothetical protein
MPIGAAVRAASTGCAGDGRRTDLMVAADARIRSQIRFFRSVMT